MSQYPPAQHPQHGWHQPYSHPGHQPPRRPPRSRTPLVFLLVALLIVAGATTAIVLATSDGSSGRAAGADEQSNAPRTGGSQDGGSEVPTVSVAVPGWSEGQPITEETLGAVPPEEIFWTVYKRHAMIPVQELIQEPWVAPAGKPLASGQVTPQTRTIRVVFDYQTKEFANATTSRVNGQLDSASICVDSKLYMKTGTDLKEGRPYSLYPQDQNGARDCPLVLDEDAYKQNSIIATWLNDAFMTGGLTSDQADRFIACLREQKLVSVTKVAMVQPAGKKYVAIEGEVNRIDDSEGNSETKQGTNLLRQCFDDGTGLDQRRHPYPFTVGGLQGLKWIYYLDPNTLRPAFSKVQTTPVLSPDGSASPQNAEYNESVSWVQWNYPQAVPKFTLADGEQALRVAWPQDLPGK